MDQLTEQRLSELKADYAERGEAAFDELIENCPDSELPTLAKALSEFDDDQEGEPETSELPLIELDLKPGETRNRGVVRRLITPALQAALSIQTLTTVSGDIVDTNELIDELEHQVNQLKSGETSRSESILCSQAHTLDALFNNLIHRAFANITGGYFEAGQKYLSLALRAQSQCRTTVDCLTGMKQPVIRQTNIAHGHQQVNNYRDKNPPNELLEESDGERMDI